MTRRLLLTGLALLAVVLAGRKAVRAQSPAVTYGTGWNLVSGPDGSHLSGAAGALYTLQPGDTTYERVPADSALKGGWGYWAYFPNGGSLQAPSGAATSSTPDPIRLKLTAGSCVMAGDPSLQSSVMVTNASQVLTYTPDGGYQPALVLRPGQGAFVTAPGSVVIGNEPSVPAPGDPACGAPGNASTTVQTHAGQQFVVSLNSNPTTGYMWFLIGAVDPAALDFVQNVFVSPAPPSGSSPVVGQGGKECWTFRALRDGTSMIQFEYRRPFEPLSASPVNAVTITVMAAPAD
jgi:inhibitor of cysteine peptidase